VPQCRLNCARTLPLFVWSEYGPSCTCGTSLVFFFALSFRVRPLLCALDSRAVLRRWREVTLKDLRGGLALLVSDSFASPRCMFGMFDVVMQIFHVPVASPLLGWCGCVGACCFCLPPVMWANGQDRFGSVKGISSLALMLVEHGVSLSAHVLPMDSGVARVHAARKGSVRSVCSVAPSWSSELPLATYVLLSRARRL
jgi:hypothetical protein